MKRVVWIVICVLMLATVSANAMTNEEAMEFAKESFQRQMELSAEELELYEFSVRVLEINTDEHEQLIHQVFRDSPYVLNLSQELNNAASAEWEEWVKSALDYDVIIASVYLKGNPEYRYESNPIYDRWLSFNKVNPCSYSYAGWFLTFHQSQGSDALKMVLADAEVEGWFTNWSFASHQALIERMIDMWPSPLLLEGIARNMSAGEAIHELFVSFFGDEAGWNECIWQWRNAELDKYGVEYFASPILESSSVTYEVPGAKEWLNFGKTVTRFSSEIPQSVADVFSQLVLEGWKCVCGTYAEPNGNNINGLDGLAVFEKENRRVLLSFDQDTFEPISDTAVYADKDIFILLDPYTYMQDSGNTGAHWIVGYQNGPAETERFYFDSFNRITLYSKVNTATGNSLIITPVDYYSDFANVKVFEDGQLIINQDLYQVYPSLMTVIDADKFSDAKFWLTEQNTFIPRNYAQVGNSTGWIDVTSGGSICFDSGVLVKLLDEIDYEEYPYEDKEKKRRVQIGAVEGMAGSLEIGPFHTGFAWGPAVNNILNIGKVQHPIKLKSFASDDSETVMELPAGKVVRLLYTPQTWRDETIEWLPISVSEDELLVHMQPDEVVGYIKLSLKDGENMIGTEYNEINYASSLIGLEWLNLKKGK